MCFKYDPKVQERGITLRWPTYSEDQEGRPGQAQHPSEWDPTLIDNEDELLEWLAACAEFDFATPAFELLMLRRARMVELGKPDKNVEVCPIAFIDESVTSLVMMEAFCERYGMSPTWPPAVDKQDPKIMEAFAVIVSTKNKYEIIKMERNSPKGGKRGSRAR